MLFRSSQSGCIGYKAATTSLSIPVNVVPGAYLTISASPVTGSAQNPANAVVTIHNGIKPYDISCFSSDYRSNCSITSNDGTNSTTIGVGGDYSAKISPEINGGVDSNFNVKAWALFSKDFLGNNGSAGQVTFKVRDSGCHIDLPYSITTLIFAP